MGRYWLLASILLFIIPIPMLMVTTGTDGTLPLALVIAVAVGGYFMEQKLPHAAFLFTFWTGNAQAHYAAGKEAEALASFVTAWASVLIIEVFEWFRLRKGKINGTR